MTERRAQMQDLRAPALRPSGRRPGVSLIEILIATIILAFSMIPVFGVMTSGMIRTDINVGYTNAIEVASGLMNHLLSEETPLSTIPISGASTYPLRGDLLGTGQGSVAADTALDRFFPASEWTTDTAAGTRSNRINGIEYHVMIWIKTYAGVNDLRFGFFENPIVDFHLGANPAEFEKLKTLTSTDYAAGFAPWSAVNLGPAATDVFPAVAASRVTSNPWTRVETVLSQADLSEGAAPYANFAKILIRISWGEDLRKERGRAKDFWLISFKAELQQ